MGQDIVEFSFFVSSLLIWLGVACLIFPMLLRYFF